MLRVKLPKDVYVIGIDYDYNKRGRHYVVKRLDGRMGLGGANTDRICRELEIKLDDLVEMWKQFDVKTAVVDYNIPLNKKGEELGIFPITEIYFKNSTTAHKALEWVEHCLVALKLNEGS